MNVKQNCQRSAQTLNVELTSRNFNFTDKTKSLQINS